MSILRPGLQRLRVWHFIMLASLAVGLPWIAITLAAMTATTLYLAPEIQMRTEIISHLIRTDIAHAQDIGIPLDKLVGMTPYLEDIIHQNQGIIFIAIADADGRLLYGVRVQGIHRRMHAIEAGTKAEDLTKTYRDHNLIVSVALGAGNQAKGELLVGADAAPPQWIFDSLQLKLLIGLFVTLFASYEFLLFSFGRVIAVPVVAADALIDRIAQGDLRYTERLVAQGRPGKLLATLNRIVRVLHDRVIEFKIYADEVRRSTLDAQTAKRIGTFIAAIDRDLALPSSIPTQRATESDRPLKRLVLFLVATATASLVPFLYATAPAGAGTVLPLAAFIAALLLAGRTLMSLFSPVPPRIAIVLALLMVALGLSGMLLTVTDVASAVIAAAILGCGVSLLATRQLDLDRQAERHAALADAPGAALLSGGVCGMGLSDLLARFGDDGMAHWSALAPLLLAGLIAWIGAGPRTQSAGREGWLHGTEIAIALGRWRFALGSLGLMAPSWALAALLLLFFLPGQIDARDTGGALAEVFLLCLLLGAIGHYLAVFLGEVWGGGILLLALAGRLLVAAAALLVAGTPTPFTGIAIFITAFGLGMLLALDGAIARHAGLHEGDIGPRRALLLNALAIGIAVPAALAGAGFLDERHMSWLLGGLALVSLAASLLYAGLGARVPGRVAPPETGR